MMFRPDHKKVIYTRASVPYGWAGALHWGVTTIFRPFLLERFVPDGINSVGDYNSPRVGVVVVVVCPPFLKSFTMGFLLNALSKKVEIWYGALV